jgi:hypothetical protein
MERRRSNIRSFDYPRSPKKRDTISMARGWESKSVESQIESAAAARPVPSKTSPEEARRNQQRHSLELDRTRVLHDLEAARNERHREMLKAALAFLDEKLRALDQH